VLAAVTEQAGAAGYAPETPRDWTRSKRNPWYIKRRKMLSILEVSVFLPGEAIAEVEPSFLKARPGSGSNYERASNAGATPLGEHVIETFQPPVRVDLRSAWRRQSPDRFSPPASGLGSRPVA